MSPRKSVVEAAATRARIIERALTLGAVDGLEGLTIGRLAIDLGMSKAGVIGQFGTKEALQLAVVDEAVERFRSRVPGHALGAHPGIERLSRAFEEWIDYMTEDEDHRGCFLTSVAIEYDDRPGPVRDAILAALSRWSDYVSAELDEAVKLGELPNDTDIPQLVFELGGVALAVQQAILMHHDPTAADRGRRSVHRILNTHAH